MSYGGFGFAILLVALGAIRGRLHRRPARLLSLEARRSGQSKASPWTVTAQRTRPFATIARIDQAG